jgi:hypothetical protein
MRQPLKLPACRAPEIVARSLSEFLPIRATRHNNLALQCHNFKTDVAPADCSKVFHFELKAKFCTAGPDCRNYEIDYGFDNSYVTRSDRCELWLEHRLHHARSCGVAGGL